jgi:hypothetical protein
MKRYKPFKFNEEQEQITLDEFKKVLFSLIRKYLPVDYKMSTYGHKYITVEKYGFDPINTGMSIFGRFADMEITDGNKDILNLIEALFKKYGMLKKNGFKILDVDIVDFPYTSPGILFSYNASTPGEYKNDQVQFVLSIGH